MYDLIKEWPLILTAATAFGVDPYAATAIRVVENGAAGREFGVLSEPAPNYTDQLRIACKSLHNEILRYGSVVFDYNGRLCYTKGFVEAFAKRWAPPLVANDPHELNQNWADNFWNVYLSFIDKGGPIEWQKDLANEGPDTSRN